MEVIEQDFMAAVKELGLTFLMAKLDGSLGLDSKSDATPIWYNMLDQEVVSDHVISFWLNRNAQDENGGDLVFGGWIPVTIFDNILMWLSQGRSL